MKTAFRESFARDVKGLRDKKLLKRVKEVIENVEKADSLTSLPHVKKLKGEKNYFRIRVGDYRLGLVVENDTVVFVRFSVEKTSIDTFHRKPFVTFVPFCG